MTFSIKDFFSKCDQIRRKLWIWSHLVKKLLLEKFIFCEVDVAPIYSTLYSEAKIVLLSFNNTPIIYESSPDFASNIKQIQENQLTPLPLKSGWIGVNYFA